MTVVPLVETKMRTIAVIGNPNSGKTTVFNALTGLRQKVGNYPGVTVEKKEGKILFGDGTEAILLDLPGTYSLSAQSPDEKIATDILLGRVADTPSPDLVVCVVDASNLERNLYLVAQVLDYQIPVVIALNMVDLAQQEGMVIDDSRLSTELGVPVVPVVATKKTGIPELRKTIAATTSMPARERRWILPRVVEDDILALCGRLQDAHGLREPEALNEAIDLLSGNGDGNNHSARLTEDILEFAERSRKGLDEHGIDRASVFVESRYQWIQQVCDRVVQRNHLSGPSLSDRLDRVLTHKVWGFLIFVALMALMFQTIFSWATVPMDLIGQGISWVGNQVVDVMPAGDLRDLVVNGALAGVGAVVTFLPQIMFLFLFLGILEDSGYMARAAFIMDRLMNKVGLHGKSFIPMLSSFACAIPGLMATRTIESRKDRIVTMLVSPLVSCSARLPVYALMIATFIPQRNIYGFISLPGVTLVSMYLLGLVAALLMAWLFKKTLLKGEAPVFILELPPYRIPTPKSIFLHMWERSYAFLKRAGTFILAVSIVLWFLASYPKREHATAAEQLNRSFAGQTGHAIEPLIRPLGFDWKIGIGLVGSLLQREVFVSTMGTIYNINDSKGSGVVSLREHLRQDVDPATGRPVFSILTAICLMVYYVLAMQCMSTVAVMRRETNSWRWPLFQIAYMTALAYVVTFAVYRVGLLIV